MAGDNIGEAFVEVSAETSGFGDQVVSAAQSAGDDAASAFSSAFGAAFTDIPPVDVPVSADTTEAESALAALPGDAGPIDVPVHADVSDAEAQITALPSEAPPVEIPVTADTSDAESQISDLGSAASDTGLSLSSAGDAGQQAAQGIGAAGAASAATGSLSAAASGDMNAFASGVGSLGGAASGAVAGVAALGAGVGFLFSEGVTASSAIERMNSVTGQFKADVENVNVGNLNESLGTLGKQLGETTPAMQTAATNAFQFAQSSGVGGEKAAQFSNEIVALASRAVAANPSLGSVGDVAATLTTKFASGRGALGAYGIDLKQADINSLALAETGKSLSTELTKGEKAIAAADLATHKYGDSLRQSVQNASQNATIQLRQLRASFVDAAGEIGKPLVSPLIETLKSLVPIGVAAGQIIGQLGTVALPLLRDAAAAVTPTLGAVSSALNAIPAPIQQVAIAGLAASIVLPRLASAGTAVADVFARTVSGVGGFAGSLAVAVPVIAIAGAGIGAYGVATHNALEATLGFAASGAALGSAFGPVGTLVGAAAGALVGYTSYLALADDGTSKFQQANDKLGSAIKDHNIPAIASAGTQLQNLISVIQPGTSIVGKQAESFVALSETLKGTGKSLGDFTDGNNRLTTAGAASLTHIVSQKVATDAWNEALKAGPPEMLATINLMDKLGLSTDKQTKQFNDQVTASQRLATAQAQVAVSTDPLAAGLAKSATAAGAATQQLFELSGVQGQEVDATAKAAQAHQAFTQALASGNIEGAQQAAVAQASQVQQQGFSSALLQGASNANAARIGTAGYRDTLVQLASQAQGPAKAAIEGLIHEFDVYNSQHPNPTVDANIAPALGKAAQASDTINAIHQAFPSIINADGTPASGQAHLTQSEIDAIHQAFPTLINADGSPARGVGEATAAYISGLRPTMTINAVVGNLGAVTSSVGAAVAAAGSGAARGAHWQIPGFAGGGTPDVGGMFTVGEEGPELMSIRPGAIDVLSGPQTRHVLADSGGSGIERAAALLIQAAEAHLQAAASLDAVSGLAGSAPSRNILRRR